MYSEKQLHLCVKMMPVSLIVRCRNVCSWGGCCCCFMLKLNVVIVCSFAFCALPIHDCLGVDAELEPFAEDKEGVPCPSPLPFPSRRVLHY